MCVCVCVCLCVYLCMYVCMYVCMKIYIYIYIYIYNVYDDYIHINKYYILVYRIIFMKKRYFSYYLTPGLF